MSNTVVDYNDERFKQVETDKQNALTENSSVYDEMISQTDSYYDKQIEETRNWAEKQQQLQQEQTDFAIEQIEQQKAQSEKEYKAEQSASYVDYQKQSNKFGVEAEQMAANGLANTGFSESSKVSMYNAYQNRVATARNSYNQIVMNYNNGIKEAQLQNSSALAEIAYNAMVKELEISLEGFQYKNQLLEQQANKKLEIDNMYYGRYQDVLNQINQENAFAEEIRQYNENLQMQKEQFTEEIRQYNESMQLEKDKFTEEQRQYNQSLQMQKEQLAEEIRQYNESMQLQKQKFEEEIRQFEQSYVLQSKQFTEEIRQFDEEMARLKKKDAEEYALEIQHLEMQKAQAEEAKRQWEIEYQLKKDQLEEEKRQFDKQLEQEQSQYEEQLEAIINKLDSINKETSASASSSSNTAAPTSINGYGKLTRTSETYYVDGIDVPIYTTSDGTWWWWDWKNEKWSNLGKNVNKPDAVKRQEVVKSTVGSAGLRANNGNASTVLLSAAAKVGDAVKETVASFSGSGRRR